MAFAIGWDAVRRADARRDPRHRRDQAGTGQGALLLGVYSAGLAIPFLLAAVAFTGSARVFGFFGRHRVALTVGSGLLLISMGALVASGQLFRPNIEVREALDGLDLDQLWGI